jgi:hypothetical protein
VTAHRAQSPSRYHANVRRLVLIAVALAGCDRVLGLGPIVPDPDAPIDEPCPADFGPITGAPPTSRYLYSAVPLVWQYAETTCEMATTTKITHLVVFDDMVEITMLGAFIQTQGLAIDRHVQAGFARDTGSDPNVFFAVTGAEVDAGNPLWQMGEPNGAPPNEETTTWFDGYHLLTDGLWSLPQAYLCECDHHPVTRTFNLHP